MEGEHDMNAQERQIAQAMARPLAQMLVWGAVAALPVLALAPPWAGAALVAAGVAWLGAVHGGALSVAAMSQHRRHGSRQPAEEAARTMTLLVGATGVLLATAGAVIVAAGWNGWPRAVLQVGVQMWAGGALGAAWAVRLARSGQG